MSKLNSLNANISQQYILDLRASNHDSVSSFVVSGANENTFNQWILPQIETHKGLCLFGESLSGKTHLAHIYARVHSATYIDGPELLARNNHFIPTSYVIDNAHQADQTSLFHLFNHCVTHRFGFAITTSVHPLEWEIYVSDLDSRLKSLRVLPLSAPDETHQIAILQKLFNDRLISPTPEVLDYILERCDRSVKGMRKIVMNLEEFANGRAFTRGLVRDYLTCEAQDNQLNLSI